ncbi:MAG: FkbM family methyltransferase [Saprospiraceae bacterium]
MERTKYNQMLLPEKKIFWADNPITGNSVILIPGLPAFIMFSTNDDVVVKELFWTEFTGWEFISLLLWNYMTLKSSGHVLDIGSYSGIYSLIAALNHENEVYAFDIQKVCVDRVNKNRDANNFSNITSHHKGLTDKNGETIYHYNQEDNFLTSIASLKKRKAHDSTQKVTIEKGDDALKNLIHEGKITNIKIDVEDLEKQTLKGLKNTIELHNPNLLIEILHITEVRKVKKLLPKNYHCYRIQETSSTILPFHKWIPNRKIGRNYLFTTDKSLLNDFKFHLPESISNKFSSI